MAKRMKARQLTLPFGPIRNSHLLSSHWLKHRLALEPEWEEYREKARMALSRLGQLWRQERDRVTKYGEPSLEEKFIQPVLEGLGWTFLYQTFLRGWKPDYAMFFANEDLNAALQVGRKSPAFWDQAAIVGDAKAWWDNIREEEIRELEGIFRHIYRKDTRANKLNTQRSFKKLTQVRKDTKTEGWLASSS